ncbi:MAG: DUF3604 domain-containing protein, partial [Halioglobus sp.]|nr:DUF3604 domain-containing protein [Halioglobus sp.]
MPGKVSAQLAQALEPIRAETAAQDEAAVPVPAPREQQRKPFSEDRNVYFGDTHVHTALSFDATLNGNRLSLDDAYRFAMGWPLTLLTGETMQLSRPLDFVVMTDHAESYGLFVTCGRDDLNERQRRFCAGFDQPDKQFFQRLREEGQKRPPQRSRDLCGGNEQGCLDDARVTWRQVREAADKYNKPGEFTAFAGYEYSPPLPRQGKIHRNVVFRSSATPERAVSAFDAATVLDLWRALERECSGDCDFLTIPHNMNKSWGIAYSGRTIDGDKYDKDDWALRGRSEPLAEIFQAKGSSECGLGVGASDEECNFELVVPVCEGPATPGCSGRTSFAREGLKIGLELQQDFGFNPLQFGFIGSTDTHNSSPGDTEEYDWRGVSALHSSPARRRLGLESANRTFAKQGTGKEGLRRNPGGLAAVWARENTRDALFEAMENREAYATSGNRILLRFFAGWDFPAGLLADADFVGKAYGAGVPMGGVLAGDDERSQGPEFLVMAQKDSMANNLQRVQMVKAWVEDGRSHERVIDIACSDGLVPDPESGRCPDNGASVDLKSCKPTPDKGDATLAVRWRDPDFRPEQAAVYYVRVLENPGCRWTAYDALRVGVEPPQGSEPVIQERAWS